MWQKFVFFKNIDNAIVYINNPVSWDVLAWLQIFQQHFVYFWTVLKLLEWLTANCSEYRRWYIQHNISGCFMTNMDISGYIWIYLCIFGDRLLPASKAIYNGKYITIFLHISGQFITWLNGWLLAALNKEGDRYCGIVLLYNWDRTIIQTVDALFTLLSLDYCHSL